MLDNTLSTSPLGCYALNKMRCTDEVHGAYTKKLVHQNGGTFLVTTRLSDAVPLSICSEGRDFHGDWFLRALQVLPPLGMV